MRTRQTESASATVAYPPLARTAAAACAGTARLALPVLLAVVLRANDPPITLPVLLRLTFAFAILPAALAAALERRFRADVTVAAASLRVRHARLALEVPEAALAAIAPWRLPLPGPGLTLRLRSGRRLPVSIASADPAALLERLGTAGIAAATAALRHPGVAYARARAAYRRDWRQRLGKFPLFALLPTAILFNAHQHIAYGGTFGQYYLLGPRAYFATFAGYWTTLTIYLVLYAGTWRWLAESVALADAWFAPRRAATTRRAVEVACAAVYYAGVPLLLALRFAA